MGAALGLVMALATALAAQDALGRALDLERQGRHEEAVAAFRVMLARDPLDVQGLLGSERVYTQMGRRDSILALVARALAADSAHALAHTIAVRTAMALGGERAAAEAIARWMAAAPGSEAPWRELVRLLTAAGRLSEAREAVDTARARLKDPLRLQAELARIEAADGNWGRAAAEWRELLLRQRETAPVASFNLRGAPAAQRERVLRVLVGSDSAAAPWRTAADLLLAWSQPDRAWDMLRRALPEPPEERRSLVQAFAERARLAPGVEPKAAAAAALEFLAEESSPGEAVRLRIEAARAWTDAGDAAAARRVLRVMAEDPAAPAYVGASSATALVELNAREGNAAEAARLLAANRDRIAGSEADRLRITVARAWIGAGEFARAESLVVDDPSLAADDVRGWVALYGGRLREARALLRSAGLAAADDPASVERAAVVALITAVRADSLPRLGAALFRATRGDTARAVEEVLELARGGSGGTPELLALAARWSAGRDPARAQALWAQRVGRHPDAAPAAAAALALARSEAARGDLEGARTRLEALILRYPDSALLPEARRELDRVRGLVPRS